MNINKNNIYKIFINIFIFIIILITIFLIVELCINYRKKREPVYYNVLTPIVDNGKNMKYCLDGCIRGMCNKNNANKKNCKFNFQCSYCQDKKTNMFYARFNKEKKVVPIYNKSKKLNNKQKMILNKRIDENNIYVKELNKKINILNQ